MAGIRITRGATKRAPVGTSNAGTAPRPRRPSHSNYEWFEDQRAATDRLTDAVFDARSSLIVALGAGVSPTVAIDLDHGLLPRSLWIALLYGAVWGNCEEEELDGFAQCFLDDASGRPLSRAQLVLDGDRVLLYPDEEDFLDFPPLGSNTIDDFFEWGIWLEFTLRWLIWQLGLEPGTIKAKLQRSLPRRRS